MRSPRDAVNPVRPLGAKRGPPERFASRLRRARILRRAKGDAQIDRSARIGAKVHVEVDRGARLIVEPGCSLGDHVRIFVRAGTVELRAGASLRERSSVVGVDHVLIGERVDVGERAAIIDLEPGLADVEAPLRQQAVLARGIEIGAGALIAPAAVVETGARVPERGRLAAGDALAQAR